jgi:hypothetical protein
MISDDASAQDLEFTDRATGVHVALGLPAQHAALALIGKKEKAIIANYGF